MSIAICLFAQGGNIIRSRLPANWEIANTQTLVVGVMSWSRLSRTADRRWLMADC